MRKLVSCLLLFALLAPFSGTYLYLAYQKKMTKRAVKQKMILGLDKKDLVWLTFHKNDVEGLLTWKHSKEFGYKNQMYDVVYTHHKQDSVSYICWLDSEENELNIKLAKLVKQLTDNSPDNKSRKTQMTVFYSSLFCEQPAWWQLAQTVNISLDYPQPIFSLRNSIATPPFSPPESGSAFFA